MTDWAPWRMLDMVRRVGAWDEVSWRFWVMEGGRDAEREERVLTLKVERRYAGRGQREKEGIRRRYGFNAATITIRVVVSRNGCRVPLPLLFLLTSARASSERPASRGRS